LREEKKERALPFPKKIHPPKDRQREMREILEGEVANIEKGSPLQHRLIRLDSYRTIFFTIKTEALVKSDLLVLKKRSVPIPQKKKSTRKEQFSTSQEIKKTWLLS